MLYFCRKLKICTGGNMKNYEINEGTLAIISVSDHQSKVVENEEEYLVDKSAYEIMDESCRYFGSSYEGRVVGARAMLDANYKLPIIVEESRRLIFFPTESPSLEGCMWISLQHFDTVSKDPKNALIYFKNGKKIETHISSYSLKNQFLRATLLESILNQRKNH